MRPCGMDVEMCEWNRTGPDSERVNRRDHPCHVEWFVRFRLHLYEVMAPFMTPGDVLGHEPMGCHCGRRRRNRTLRRAIASSCRSTSPAATASCATRASFAVRNHAEPRVRLRCGLVRLHQALWPSAGRSGRVSTGTARELRSHQGARGSVPMTASCFFPMCCRPHGRRSNTRGCRKHVRWSCWDSDRSATCRAASPWKLRRRNSDRHRPRSDRLERARAAWDRGLDLTTFDTQEELVDAVRAMTGGRGPDAVIDAVGMEAHGSPAAKFAHRMTALLPDAMNEKLMLKAGVDRLAALQLAVELGAPRRHDLDHRRLRRNDRPAADDDAVRQADPTAHGTSQREAMGRRNHAAAQRRRPARRRRFRHSSSAAPRGGRCIRDVPEEARRCRQSALQPLTHLLGRSIKLRPNDLALTRSDRHPTRRLPRR